MSEVWWVHHPLLTGVVSTLLFAVILALLVWIGTHPQGKS
jgi:hypothetical protein